MTVYSCIYKLLLKFSGYPSISTSKAIPAVNSFVSELEFSIDAKEASIKDVELTITHTHQLKDDKEYTKKVSVTSAKDVKN